MKTADEMRIKAHIDLFTGRNNRQAYWGVFAGMNLDWKTYVCYTFSEGS